MSQRRAQTVPGTNSGSYAEQQRTAPGAAANLAPTSAPADTPQDPEREDSYEDDLAYLRSVLDRVIVDPTLTGATQDDAHPESKPSPAWELTGADMPPLTFSHPMPLIPALIEPIRHEGAFPKPLGGLWVTVGDASDPAPTRWERLLEGGHRRGGGKSNLRRAVRLRPDARVARIDSMADLDELAARFPNDPGYDADWREAFGTPGNRPLDWVKAAEVYDAIWVTDAAIMDGVNKGRHHALGAWDFESVVITNPDALDLS